MDIRRHLACACLVAALSTAAPAADLDADKAAPATPAASAPVVWAEVAVLHNGFSIRHQRREQHGGLVRLYLNRSEADYLELGSAEVARFEREPLPAVPAPKKPKPAAAAPADFSALILAASRRHGVDADLILAVIAAESAFNPRAVSHRGARGLMQLMPATAAELGLEDSFDAAGNIDAGTRYLRLLLGLYGNDLARALAAYNAGPQRVAQHNGVPPYRETRAYVARVIGDFNRRKRAAWTRAEGRVAAGDAAVSAAGQ